MLQDPVTGAGYRRRVQGDLGTWHEGQLLKNLEVIYSPEELFQGTCASNVA
jgi:hypothetical protein